MTVNGSSLNSIAVMPTFMFTNIYGDVVAKTDATQVTNDTVKGWSSPLNNLPTGNYVVTLYDNASGEILGLSRVRFNDGTIEDPCNPTSLQIAVCTNTWSYRRCGC